MGPCYHYEPRMHVTTYICMGSFCADEMAPFEGPNADFKKATMFHYCPPEKWILACKQDWDYYCRMATEQGILGGPGQQKWPKYPYTSEYQYEMERMEREDVGQEMAKRQSNQVQSRISNEMIMPGSAISFEPAKWVIRKRQQSPNSKVSKEEREGRLAEGRGVRNWILDQKREQGVE